MAIDIRGLRIAVADPGGPWESCPPPGPVKISHKNDGHHRRPHRFHVSQHIPPQPPCSRWIRYWMVTGIHVFTTVNDKQLQKEAGQNY